jgi:two-component system OmpR family sensor kinase
VIRSLRARLGLTYALIAAVMLVAVYLVAETAVDAALVGSAAERLEIEAGLVVADSESGNGATATDLAAGDVAAVLGGYGTAVAVIDANGQVLAAEANGADPEVLDARLGATDYAAVIASGQTMHAVRTAPDGRRTLVVAAPLQLRTGGPPANPGRGNGQGNGNGNGNGQGRGLGNQKGGPVASPEIGPANAVAQLAISLDGIDATVAGVRSTLQMAALGLLIVAAVAVWLITALGLRPLERVSRAAHRIATGDLAARAALPAGGDEVGRLGRAFDDMADRVDSTMQAQRSFAADASHELRSPLTVLGGYVDVLARTEVDEPTKARMLASMRGEIDRLSRLSTDLLLLTQLEGGGGRLVPKEVDVTALVEDVGEAARIVGADRRIEVSTNGSLRVLADTDRLTQAVMNLVDNAIRHTPAGRGIGISARERDGWAAIEVSNEGAPIPPEDLARVFDRFYRADRGAASNGHNGHHAGLGLAIVKAVAEASGGSVHASSTAAATTFEIRLPLAP